jgi:hypothetical protein
MLATIACLRYEMAIVLPKDDGDAAQLCALCQIILLATTALTAILTYLFGTRVLFFIKASELNPIPWLFPIYMFVIGIQLPLNWWYTRQKQFNIKATNRILNSFPISIGEIGGGWAGFRTDTNLVVIRFCRWPDQELRTDSGYRTLQAIMNFSHQLAFTTAWPKLTII